jgi:hypothetical protein
MSTNAQTIINYFAQNFDFLEDLFKFSKDNNFFIANEVLTNRCAAKDINIKRLEEYKIVKPLANGNYELNKKFMDFISFLIDDFRLELPESIKKYHYAIKEIYSQLTLDNLTLNKEKTTNQIIELSNGLINELRDFEAQIVANREQLFLEAMKIAQNNEDLDYSDKIKKASDLIENYIKPLNTILSREYADSFVKLLSQISDFANLQRNEQNNIAFRHQFEQLYQYMLNISHSILHTSSIMAKELTPFMNRLRTDSQIMKGVETFLLHAKQKKIDDFVILSTLKSKQSQKVYVTNFEISAKNVFEILKKQAAVNLSYQPPIEPQSFWIFDKQKYKQKLLEALPIDNFFDWCYTTLHTENQIDISSDKIYHIASLLFEKEIQAEFLTAEHKFKISLNDYILTVPHIKINALNHEN